MRLVVSSHLACWLTLIDDVDERLVAVEETVSARKQVALEPPLAEVLAQHFHDPARRGDVVVGGQDLAVEGAVRDLEHGAQPVGGGLVRAEEAERLLVSRDHVPQEKHAKDARGLGARRAGPLHGHGIVAEVRQREVTEEQATVGVRIGAHALPASGREHLQPPERHARRNNLVEQYLFIAARQPCTPGCPAWRSGSRRCARTLISTSTFLGQSSTSASSTSSRRR